MSTILTLTRGDSKTFAITASEDVSAATGLIFTAKKSLGAPDTAAVFQKSLGAGITVAGTTAISVAVVRVDTSGLSASKTLFWDVQAQWSTGRPATVASGTLVVDADVTRELDTSVTIYTTQPSAIASAAASAAAALLSEQAASASEDQTALDVIATAADRVQTALDVIATGSDRVAVAADKGTVATDKATVAADKGTTLGYKNAADADAIATAADRVQTGLDRTQTGLDRVATAADRVQTGLDVVATAADKLAADASAVAAAASAILAGQAVANQFLGGIAGNAVPATATAAGYYYRVTSAGTSQGKTWAVGDMAIYNGTSGSWTQLAGILPYATEAEALAGTDTTKALTPATGNARALLGDMTRVIASAFYFDGTVTTNNAQCTMGAAGNISGKVRTIVGLVYVPTAAEVSGKAYAIWSFTNSPVSGVGSVPGWHLVFNTGGAPLIIRQFAPTTADVLKWDSSSNPITLFGGTVVHMAVRQSPGASPEVFINGVAFSGTNPASTGAPSAWGTHDVAYFRLLGAGGNVGGFGYHSAPRVINAALTDAEILAHAQTGRLSSWYELAAGSEVPFYASDLSSGADGWTRNTGDANLVITGNVDAVGGVDNVLQIEAVSGDRYFQIVRPATANPQRKYRYELQYYADVGCGVPFLGLGAGGDNRGGANVAVIEGSWQSIALVGNAQKQTSGAAICGFTTLSGSTTTTLLSGKKVYFKDVKLIACGPIAKWVLQPGAVVHPDSGANKIALVQTSGVTAIGDKPAIIELPIPAMAADGFIHLDQVITPAGYELFSAVIERTAGSGTGTVTIKETSSGGTTVATGALGATPTALTISNVFSAANKKLHLANSSWSSSTLIGRPLFRRSQ
jgi:hypothetical protein